MGTLKAPGLDGFQVGFFQEYWEIVGDDVSVTVLIFFNRNSSLASINQTYIPLIPKLKSLESLLNFKSISLCNAFYKIISKSMANCMKEAFPKVISPYQSTFVKGRQISDNIIIAHEMLRFLKNEKSCNHHMAIKLGMSKAYDRVELNMVLSMIEKNGFYKKWRY